MNPRHVLLTVVFPISFGYAIGHFFSGCGSALKEIEEVATDGTVPAALRECRSQARQAYYVEHKSKDEALAKYEACKKKAGL